MSFDLMLKDYLTKNNNCEKIGLSIEEINGSFSYFLNENDLMSTASTMKLFVLGALIKKCERKEEVLNRLIEVKKEDLYPGSGVMNYLTPGIKLTVKDLLTLMIIVSDNSATNMCIDLAGGIEQVNAHIKELNIENAYINRKVYDRSPNPNKKKLAEISPKAFTSYLKKIRETDYFTNFYKNVFFDILSKQQFKDMFVRYLPLEDFYEDGEVKVFSKTGYDGGTRCDTGIIVLPDKREYAYAIMINGASDESYSFDNKTHHMMAEIGKLFFDSVK